MCDVLIVGAGPAGAVAGLVLARAGVRVRLVDRASFPRDKLCGDTVNPGTLSRLERLGVAGEIVARGLRVDGMVITGEGGVAVEGRYPAGVHGRAIVRRELDWLLVQQAIAAGCEFETGVNVRGAVVAGDKSGGVVHGVRVSARSGEAQIDAPITIAADGRRSTIGFGLGFARHPARPRRWAIGAYYENFPNRVGHPSDPRTRGVGVGSLSAPHDGAPGVEGVSDPASERGALGEMHVRRGRYIGIAPIPGGLTNVCLVRPSRPGDVELREPAALLARELQRDPLLRARANGARLASAPVVLGPLAVDVDRDRAIDGLLVAGDAAGFIDPMTGDGLRFAVRGGELAAAAALRALAHGWRGVHAQLAAERRAEFGGKWRFNRALRALVASPRAVGVAALGARVAPTVLERVIAHAGDCYLPT
jgi:flavin-dependent dehydrogenase